MNTTTLYETSAKGEVSWTWKNYLKNHLHIRLYSKRLDHCVFHFPEPVKGLVMERRLFLLMANYLLYNTVLIIMGDGRIALWCSAPSGVQSMLVDSEAEIYFIPSYVGHLGWIGMRLDGNVDWEEISRVVGEAYFNRAPKKYREMFKKQ